MSFNKQEQTGLTTVARTMSNQEVAEVDLAAAAPFIFKAVGIGNNNENEKREEGEYQGILLEPRDLMARILGQPGCSFTEDPFKQQKKWKPTIKIMQKECRRRRDFFDGVNHRNYDPIPGARSPLHDFVDWLTRNPVTDQNEVRELKSQYQYHRRRLMADQDGSRSRGPSDAEAVMVRALGLDGCDFRQEPFKDQKRCIPKKKLMEEECKRRVEMMKVGDKRRKRWEKPSPKWNMESLEDWLRKNPIQNEAERQELMSRVAELRKQILGGDNATAKKQQQVETSGHGKTDDENRGGSGDDPSASQPRGRSAGTTSDSRVSSPPSLQTKAPKETKGSTHNHTNANAQHDNAGEKRTTFLRERTKAGADLPSAIDDEPLDFKSQANPSRDCPHLWSKAAQAFKGENQPEATATPVVWRTSTDDGYSSEKTHPTHDPPPAPEPLPRVPSQTGAELGRRTDSASYMHCELEGRSDPFLEFDTEIAQAMNESAMYWLATEEFNSHTALHPQQDIPAEDGRVGKADNGEGKMSPCEMYYRQRNDAEKPIAVLLMAIGLAPCSQIVNNVLQSDDHPINESMFLREANRRCDMQSSVAVTTDKPDVSWTKDQIVQWLQAHPVAEISSIRFIRATIDSIDYTLLTHEMPLRVVQEINEDRKGLDGMMESAKAAIAPKGLKELSRTDGHVSAGTNDGKAGSSPRQRQLPKDFSEGGDSCCTERLLVATDENLLSATGHEPVDFRSQDNQRWDSPDLSDLGTHVVSDEKNPESGATPVVGRSDVYRTDAPSQPRSPQASLSGAALAVDFQLEQALLESESYTSTENMDVSSIENSLMNLSLVSSARDSSSVSHATSSSKSNEDTITSSQYKSNRSGSDSTASSNQSMFTSSQGKAPGSTHDSSNSGRHQGGASLPTVSEDRSTNGLDDDDVSLSSAFDYPEELIGKEVKELQLQDVEGRPGKYSGTCSRSRPRLFRLYPDGKGIMEYSTGMSYEGNWVKGTWHGHGKLNFAEDDFYAGDFAKGSFSGTGLRQWPDGSFYEGGWRDGKRSEKGTFHDAHKDVFDGWWQDDKLVGKGARTYADGSQYVGMFVNGLQQGKCVFRDYRGQTYRGSWVSDRRLACGSRYDGFWSNGKPTSFGTQRYPDGESYEGNQRCGLDCGNNDKLTR